MMQFMPLVDLADKLGMFNKVVDKIKNSSINQPEEATQNFIAALEEYTGFIRQPKLNYQGISPSL